MSYSTADFEKLYPRFVDYFTRIIISVGNEIPHSLLRDVEFFITEQYMTATCKTNVDIAFQLGKLDANSHLVDALYHLFLARDRMIKGFMIENVVEELNRCEKILQDRR
jgi:hypothetical protein